MTNIQNQVFTHFIETSLGQITSIINNDKIYYKILDVQNCLNYNTNFGKVIKKYGDVTPFKCKTNMGIQTCNFVERYILEKSLLKSQQENAITLIKELKLSLKIILTREEETNMLFIARCFSHLKMSRQFKVMTYKVDLFAFNTGNKSAGHKVYDLGQMWEK